MLNFVVISNLYLKLDLENSNLNANIFSVIKVAWMDSVLQLLTWAEIVLKVIPVRKTSAVH